MKFYHGTSKNNWYKIQKEGVLWGYTVHKNIDGSEYVNYRYTYLTPHIEMANKYGDVILEINYTPVGVNGQKIDNYCFKHQIPEKNATCWQFSVFIPIKLENVKKLNKFKLYWLLLINYSFPACSLGRSYRLSKHGA